MAGGKAIVNRTFEEKTVELTVTLSREGYTDVEKTFTVNVPKIDIADLTNSIKVPDSTTTDFQLKSYLGDGITVTWTSGNEAALSIETSYEKALSKFDNKLELNATPVTYAVCHRGDKDVTVPLTAAVSKDGVEKKLVISVIGKGKDR